MYIIYETAVKTKKIEKREYIITEIHLAILNKKIPIKGFYIYYTTGITYIGMFFLSDFKVVSNQIKVLLNKRSHRKLDMFTFKGFVIQDSIYTPLSWEAIESNNLPKEDVDYFTFFESRNQVYYKAKSNLFIGAYLEYKKSKQKVSLEKLTDHKLIL